MSDVDTAGRGMDDAPVSEIPMASDRDPSVPDAPWCPDVAPCRRARAGLLLLGLALLAQAGCTSALTATTLREALRETAASLSTPHDLDHASHGAKKQPETDVSEDGVAPDGDPVDEAAEEIALEKVIDNAVARLSAAGGIDPATQELLIRTLETTPPQDWAVVVNEFAATLEATRGAGATAAPDATAAAPEGASSPIEAPRTAGGGGLVMPVAPARLDVEGIAARPIEPAPPAADLQTAPSIEPTPAVAPGIVGAVALVDPVPTAAPAPPAVAPAPPAAALALSEPATSGEPVPLPPEPEAFTEPASSAVSPPPAAEATGPEIRNACFATRVRGWGRIDRFPTNAFRRGQELIVYFELDRLRIRPDGEGHTTAIDTSFRLLDESGAPIGQWTFEPIVESCPSPRRDYFARYFIRIPEDARPGRHRLEWTVTDGVAGTTRGAHLDLDVIPVE